MEEYYCCREKQHKEEQASTSKVSPPRTRARVSEPTFFLKICDFFRGDELNEEYEKKRANKLRRRIIKVTLSLKESVLKVARSRSDNTAKHIARIRFEHDLVAAEVKYHSDCCFLFNTDHWE